MNIAAVVVEGATSRKRSISLSVSQRGTRDISLFLSVSLSHPMHRVRIATIIVD